jgi:glycosyltransferase involved in cell wall biosynthesis
MSLIAIHFARLGPYHVARLRSAVEVFRGMGWCVVALETAGGDATYAWEKMESGGGDFERRTVFPDRVYEEIPSAELRKGMRGALDALKPDTVAVAGWGTVDARACLDWCRRNAVQSIVMSETRAADGRRVWWKEWIKSRIVRKFDGALCGGKSHERYLMGLGMPEERIAFGYNVVDNQFFTNIQKERNFSVFSFQFLGAGREHAQYAGRYFLASNRFVDRKNLARLIRAYARYVERFQFSAFSFQQSPGGVWPLVLLGDGELRGELEGLCGELGLKTARVFSHGVTEHTEDEDLKLNSYKLNTPTGGGLVVFAGFRQLEELPAFYRGAGAFVHPALEEPWGLVINEAMASGLPVLSSRNVGAAEELVVEGGTGYLFNPESVEEMAAAMGEMAGMPEAERLAMGRAAVEQVERVVPLRAFGEGIAKLVFGRRHGEYEMKGPA